MIVVISLGTSFRMGDIGSDSPGIYVVNTNFIIITEKRTRFGELDSGAGFRRTDLGGVDKTIVTF